MCDCNDEINNGEIPIGPTGPQGPTGVTGATGPAPTISTLSSSTVLVDTGNRTFTVDAGLPYVAGQRLIASSDDASQVVSGAVVSYAGTTLIINVDSKVGAGSNSDWNISITGAIGATGATGAAGAAGSTGAAGASAYTTLSIDATPLGGTVYQLDVVTSAWVAVGMIIYVEDAGYFTVTSISSATRIIVNDLLYPGNSAAALLIGKKVTAGGLRGAAGTNGTDGVDGFIYETLDGNGIAAEALDTYELLMRNSTNTGYTFVTLADLKILLASA